MWLLSGSNDSTVKLYDIRKLGDTDYSCELHTFEEEDNDITALEWHPVHEDMFVSAGHNVTKPVSQDPNGKLIFWMAQGKMVQRINKAHRGQIWDLAWHNFDGHSLVSGGNDTYLTLWA